MSYFKVNEKCNGCLTCVENCPAGALSYVDEGDKRTLLHNIISCARCMHCWRICPEGAVELQHLIKGDWGEVTSFNLVHCSVCGQPVYTSALQKTFKEKYDQDLETLCSLHKSTVFSDTWLRAVK